MLKTEKQIYRTLYKSLSICLYLITFDLLIKPFFAFDVPKDPLSCSNTISQTNVGKVSV